MSEPLTIDRYSPLSNGARDLTRIGAGEEFPDGVARDMAKVVGFELPKDPSTHDWGKFIGHVGPSAELQRNIEGLRDKFDEDIDPNNLAARWVTAAGMMEPVSREYINSAKINISDVNVAIISDGVANWIDRRTDALIKLNETAKVGQVLLAAGNRKMKKEEKPGRDIDGMVVGQYMEEVTVPKLEEVGLSVELVEADSSSGDDVMRRAAKELDKQADLPRDRILVVSNAAIWPQNAGQAKRALLGWYARYDHTGGQHLVYTYDEDFSLGKTGLESRVTHQNPLTAATMLPRVLHELSRHAIYS